MSTQIINGNVPDDNKVPSVPDDFTGTDDGIRVPVGGRRRKSKKSRKTRKGKKSRRTRKSRKGRKSRRR